MIKDQAEKGIFIALFCASLSCMGADKAVMHTKTTTSSVARYEIVSSTLAARYTFKLDRFCGEVSQIVQNQENELAWQDLLVSGLPPCQTDDQVRYQLFVSGIAARFTFLLNTETGKTWQYMTFKDKDGKEQSGWFPIN